MTLSDVLLPALTYPDATPERALRSGVALARRLGGALTLMPVTIDIPSLHNPLANALLRLNRLEEVEEARSAATAQLEADCARIAAEDAGARLKVEGLRAKLYEETDDVARAARTRDICLSPVGHAAPASRGLAEAVLFGSGRPMIVYADDREITPAEAFGVAAVAWDGSARAARAVADALPILRKARDVRIFIATDEKPDADERIADDLVRHLAAHGISAKVDARTVSARPIGQALSDYVASEGVDLLVMGGFGHARMREFILGGATEAMLSAPPCPVMMSH